MAFLVVMVVALNIGVEIQLSRQQRLHSCIRITGNTTVQLNSRLCQCSLSTAANPAAYQNIHPVNLQESGQCTVAASIGIQNHLVHNCAVFHLVEFKAFRVTKMLKNLSIFIGNSNFHRNSFPVVKVWC